jgi:hypothetical protein
MGLITWIAVVVTILAIIGLGWNVFVSGVYKGAQKIMGNSSILKKMTEKAQQLVVSPKMDQKKRYLKDLSQTTLTQI